MVYKKINNIIQIFSVWRWTRIVWNLINRLDLAKETRLKQLMTPMASKNERNIGQQEIILSSDMNNSTSQNNNKVADMKYKHRAN